jgi:hypothetical protein
LGDHHGGISGWPYDQSVYCQINLHALLTEGTFMPYETRLERVELFDLSEAEKVRLLDLIVDRIGCDIWAYKLDGEARIIELRARQRS